MGYQVLKSARKLRRSRDELSYKRLNWRLVARGRILDGFSRVCNEASEADFPLRLFVQNFESPSEDTIQITTEKIKTGASGEATIEDGGALVASQSITGDVTFIVYPRKSDRLQPKFKEILLFEPLDPISVTDKHIRVAARQFSFLVRVTSLYGYASVSLLDRLFLKVLLVRDLRFKSKLLYSIINLSNRWAGVIVASLLALLIAVYTKP